MLKETRTYTDYNGVERTEDFYFNFTKAELAEKHLSSNEGLSEMLNKIVNSKNNKEIVDTFKEIILEAYGEKSEDGRRFIKSPELSKAFSETPVYSDLFMELATDDEKASAFIHGILPADWDAQINDKKDA